MKHILAIALLSFSFSALSYDSINVCEVDKVSKTYVVDGTKLEDEQALLAFDDIRNKKMSCVDALENHHCIEGTTLVSLNVDKDPGYDSADAKQGCRLQAEEKQVCVKQNIENGKAVCENICVKTYHCHEEEIID